MQEAKLVPSVEQDPNRVTFAEYEQMVAAIPEAFRNPETTFNGGVRTDIFKDSKGNVIMTGVVDTNARTVEVQIGEAKRGPLSRRSSDFRLQT